MDCEWTSLPCAVQRDGWWSGTERGGGAVIAGGVGGSGGGGGGGRRTASVEPRDEDCRADSSRFRVMMSLSFATNSSLPTRAQATQSLKDCMRCMPSSQCDSSDTSGCSVVHTDTRAGLLPGEPVAPPSTLSVPSHHQRWQSVRGERWGGVVRPNRTGRPSSLARRLGCITQT